MYDLLKGMRVVEAAAFIAGPSAGMQLAQMGAEVIRIDQIGGGPDFRRWPLAPSGDSLYWENLNKGKKSIAIDLSRPEGRELAAALATAPGEDGGLFLTNFPVKGFLSYEALSARRADLVCVRVMGWADGAPALDYTINAAVGVPYMTGPRGEDAPVNHVFPAWDFICGAQAAFAMVAAESARRRTGTGADVRIALSDVAAACLSQTGQFAETLLSGNDRPRMGNDLFGAFGRDFVTADERRLMLVAITPKQWAGLVSGLGIANAVAGVEAETGASFARDEGARFVHRDRLFPLFEAAIAARPAAEIAGALDAAGVTWSEYQPLSRAVSDPRLFAGPLFQQVAHPSGLSYPAAGPAARVCGTAAAALAPAPMLGANSDQVLAEVLGLQSGAIGALRDRKIVA